MCMYGVGYKKLKVSYIEIGEQTLLETIKIVVQYHDGFT